MLRITPHAGRCCGSLLAVWVVVCSVVAPTANADSFSAPSVNPKVHPERALEQALSSLQQGRLSQALNMLEALTQKQPDFRAAQLLYADAMRLRAGHGSLMREKNGKPERRSFNRLLSEIRLRKHHKTSAATAGLVPAQLIQPSVRYDRILLVDASEHRLYVFDPTPLLQGLPPVLLNDYYITLGRNGLGKEKRGDNRTPLGVYTIDSEIAADRLPDLYGAGAFPINYPNRWDQRQNRTGDGIWLHGVPSKNYSRPPLASRGCVALANTDFEHLGSHITVGQTQVVIADKVEWLTPREHRKRRRQLLTAVERWRADWQSRNVKRYISHYSDDFFSADQQKNLSGTNTVAVSSANRATWQARKAATMADSRSIQIELSDVSLLGYAGETDMVEVRFQQRYRSETFAGQTRKLQYWKYHPRKGWKIALEEQDDPVVGSIVAENSATP